MKVASEAEVERLARREKDREEALKAIEKRREERRKENQAPVCFSHMYLHCLVSSHINQWLPHIFMRQKYS